MEHRGLTPLNLNRQREREKQQKTVSVLCQSDRHFLAFSDTTRNEHQRIGSLKATTFQDIPSSLRDMIVPKTLANFLKRTINKAL